MSMHTVHKHTNKNKYYWFQNKSPEPSCKNTNYNADETQLKNSVKFFLHSFHINIISKAHFIWRLMGELAFKSSGTIINVYMVEEKKKEHLSPRVTRLLL